MVLTMAYKDNEKKKEYARQHYKDNALYYREKADKHRKKKVAWLKKFKETLTCEMCGEACSVCLEFHHTGDDKKIDVAQAAHNAWSVEKMLEEIAKCNVLCANCHRKVHATLA